MIAGCRKLIVKLTVCMIYVIGLLLIAKRIMRLPDSFAFDKSLDVHATHSAEKKSYGIAASRRIVEDGEERDEYEKWIFRWDHGIVQSLGHYGKPGKLFGRDEAKAKEALKTKALNVVLSDKTPLTRKLPDVRDPLCSKVKYDSELPSASVIIIFYNEPWSVLLRTVRSVLDGSPENLLKEIILVDDHSDEEELKGRLDYYIETRFPKKVKIIRLNKRLGLIRARLSGARSATGDVLVFLDAHCEVIVQWLEPLLQQIKEKQNAVLMPIIDNISEETLEYKHDNDPTFFLVGGFTWAGHFTWMNIQEKELKSRATRISPIKSPTMAGGLFAVDRKYFWEVGSYDDRMDGWGGENLEMSFRIWQCGGSLETIPCSRVGHIFRNFHPYKFPNDKDTHGINTARLVYVWMDDYKRLFLLHRQEFKENKETIGDLSDRVELRQRLKCKNFKWYLENIYPEKFIPDENVIAYGRVKLRDRNLCLDNLQRNEDKPYDLGMYGCHAKLFPSQLFSLSNAGELRRDEVCATFNTEESDGPRPKVRMLECQVHGEEKEWILTEEGKIVHVATGLCLDGTGLKNESNVFVSTCSDDVPDQFWQFDFHGDKILPR